MEESLSHGLSRGVGSEFQFGGRQAWFDGRVAEARAPSNARLDAHERHEAKKALDRAAQITVTKGKKQEKKSRIMGPCVTREPYWDPLYYVCDHCRRVHKHPPAYVVRIWQRSWFLCSHECWVEHLRGY